MSAEDKPRRRTPLSWVLLLIPLAVAAALGTLFARGLQNQADTLPSALIGQLVPEFSLPPLAGRRQGLSSADLRGQVSLVNVWASWCAPCRTEMPLLVELAEAGTVPIFGINYKDDPDGAAALLKEVGDAFTQVGVDATGRVAVDWGVYGMPETFIVDADGRIAYKHVGPFDRSTLEDEILLVVARLQAQAREGT